ncbi:TQXA domain-containing protein [Haloactinospora alba]|uniref:TQXA domain-containing protein n=1 Tax=Haloactinospora alba TaxID=405555 RepID=A0A543NGD5_9ACTN|nr:thioester domain-containing protein [Haloactinospora alba]TQN30864.1 TQXA domain-containing protein [Haloactinospora alba]
MTFPPYPRNRARKSASVAAATTAALLAFGFAATPAAADGAEGTYVGNEANGVDVHMGGDTAGTSLFQLDLKDGPMLRTYCIDFETDIRGGADYEEDEWSDYPGKGDFADPAKVHWILQNSYPSAEVGELAEKSGVEGLNQKQAIAGTQAAIWHFSNDLGLDEKNGEKVTALYDYLVDNAEEVKEPEASVSIEPESAEGTAGEVVGEFTLSTSAESVSLDVDAPEGVELVDPDSGDALSEAADGDQFGFSVPQDADKGEATVSTSVSAEVPRGRLFQGVEGEDPTQTLITADTDESTVTAQATASWKESAESPSPTESPTTKPPEETPPPEDTESPSPTPTQTQEKPAPEKPEQDDEGLPVTGTALGGLVAAAVAAVGAGGAAIYLSRKRRSNMAEE